MQTELFNNQIERLRTAYGNNNFSDAHVEIIWSYVKAQPGYWFESTISKFISTSRKAPLPLEFLDAIDTEKFSSPSLQGYEPHPKDHSVFTAQDISEFKKVIFDVVDGKMSADDARQYADIIAKAIRPNEAQKNC